MSQAFKSFQINIYGGFDIKKYMTISAYASKQAHTHSHTSTHTDTHTNIHTHIHGPPV